MNKIAPSNDHDHVMNIPENASDPAPSAKNHIMSDANKKFAWGLEFICWTGSILVLIPYIVVFEKSIDFALNTAGASGLLIICIKTRQTQSIVINFAWIVGGIYKYLCN